MEIINSKTIKLDKEINELDKFLLEFVKILEKHARYVIVSGYVSILFGRARATEDIDILIEPITKEKFELMWREIERNGFWCLNADSCEDAFNMLKENIPIRIARKNEIIPNIEVKVCKSCVDFETLKERVKVMLNEKEIFISPIEMQIAYKEEKLKNEKDMEDALHLREVFSEIISEEKIQKYKEMIKNG